MPAGRRSPGNSCAATRTIETLLLKPSHPGIAGCRRSDRSSTFKSRQSIGRQAAGACCIFADPDQADVGQVFWDPAVNAYALSASVAKADPDDATAVNLPALPATATILYRPAAASVLILAQSDRVIQLELQGTAELDGPLHLRWDITGLAGLPPRLMALHRLAALYAHGRMPKALFPPVARLERMITALRAADGRQEAAKLSQIADALFGPQYVAADWRNGSDYLRSRMRRLLHLSRQLIRGGYRRFLR